MSDQQTTKPNQMVIVLAKGLEDANLILGGLGELPGKFSFDLLKRLEIQIKQQLDPPKEQPDGPNFNAGTL